MDKMDSFQRKKKKTLKLRFQQTTKVLASSKLKGLADDMLNVTIIDWVKTLWKKRRKCWLLAFSFYHNVFKGPFSSGAPKVVIMC